MDSEGNLKAGQTTTQRETFKATAASAVRVVIQLAHRASDVKQSVAEPRKGATDQLEQQRESAAIALSRTASALRGQGARLARATHSAADNLESAAEYFRAHDVTAISEDARELVRRHPGPALATAAFIGFAPDAARIKRR